MSRLTHYIYRSFRWRSSSQSLDWCKTPIPLNQITDWYS